ncbi:hypothetical protein [Pseudomonas hunanensis]|uniref:hypothetical protein n=1 Tax=Pseudomonas hunanensis TaxID=1247546 RepID=UPI0015C05464|nr:hypothetical protein [Pseudomonas hunanensis]
MAFSISRSKPFRHLQSKIGHSTYRLNTIFVGLSCVAAGQGDGGAIAVSWKKPSDSKAGEVANQARIFACAGALSLSFDIFDCFLTSLVKETWMGFSRNTVDIVTKAVTRPGQGEYSVAERVSELCIDLGIDDPVRVAAIELMAKWRNAVVHGTDREVRLSDGSKKALLAAKQEFYDNYSHLDIALAVKNFESKKVPVSKEVTSLAAIIVNFSRRLDEAAIKRAAGDEQSIKSATTALLKRYFSVTPNPWVEISNSWNASLPKRKDALSKFLANAGITESGSGISAELPLDYLDDVCGLSIHDFALKFEIKPLKCKV